MPCSAVHEYRSSRMPARPLRGVDGGHDVPARALTLMPSTSKSSSSAMIWNRKDGLIISSLAQTHALALPLKSILHMRLTRHRHRSPWSCRPGRESWKPPWRMSLCLGRLVLWSFGADTILGGRPSQSRRPHLHVSWLDQTDLDPISRATARFPYSLLARASHR